MSSIFGNHIQISIFGQSHSAAIGVVIDGLPAGERIDEEELQSFLARRAPGQSDLTTARREADQVRILSGLYRGCTCGAPLAAEIENRDVRSRDYEKIADIPRPGHADYTAHVKYGGWEDYRGGGHFSGRLTAPLCVAGGIAKQILARRGIRIEAAIDEIGGVTYEDAVAGENVTTEKEAGALPAAWTRMIATVREEGDSLGGIICCRISGMPAGVGSPMFDGLENRIAQVVFAIPAVKGLEFGAGFQAARMRGSENNDPFCLDEEGQVATATNHHGGILGGISSGMDITFRAAFKPTPSIAKEQDSISFSRGEDARLSIQGRHDPCIVLRAVPVVEAAAAVALLDALAGEGKL